VAVNHIRYFIICN